MPPENIIAVPLFQSAHAGFGDSHEVAPYRYNRVLYGFDARYPGELRFGDFMQNVVADPAQVVGSAGPATWAAEWRDSGGTNPVLIYTCGNRMVEIIFNSAATRGAALGGRNTGTTFHDNGAGVDRIIIALRGVNIGSRALDNTADSITGTIVRDKLASISGALYGSATPSGSSRFSGISFVPYGSAPTTAANWSSITRVGWPSTDINNIISVRGVPATIKPEGIFMYNRGKDQWENMMPGWEADPHPDNGRAVVSRGPDAVISRGRGGCVLFDGYSVRDISPHLDGSPNEDTTQDRISCLALWKGWIVAVTSVSQAFRGGSGCKEAHGLSTGAATCNKKVLHVGNSVTEGVRFWRTQDNEVTFTNGSANAGDGSQSTTVVLSSQDTAANGDFFAIGYRYPWRACLVSFDVNVSPSLANITASTLTAQYWDGTAWQTMAIADLTRPAGDITLGQTGLIILTSNPSDWTARTYGTAGVDDSGGYYYIRFAVSVVLDTSVEIGEVRIIPWRPAIDTTDHPNDGIDRSGCYPHVLFGQITDKGAIWHDMGTPAVADEIGAVAGGHVGGTVGVDPRKIVLAGLTNIYYFHETDSDTWPWLAPRGLIEFPFRSVAGGQPVRLKSVRVDGRDFNGLTSLSFYYRYDSNERWSKVLLGNRPPFRSQIKGSASAGANFQWAIGYVMSDTTDPHVQRRPAITSVDAEFEPVPERDGMLTQRTIAATPRG